MAKMTLILEIEYENDGQELPTSYVEDEISMKVQGAIPSEILRSDFEIEDEEDEEYSLRIISTQEISLTDFQRRTGSPKA